MADATKKIYVTIGGFMMGNDAVECFDWSGLLASPPKRGENRVIPGLAGAEVRPRMQDELRASISVRLNGEREYETGAFVAGEEAKIENYWRNLMLLRGMTEQVEVQTLVLATPWQWYEAGCQVESGGTPRHLNPWTAELVLDLTLPEGVPLPSESYAADNFYGGAYS